MELHIRIADLGPGSRCGDTLLISRLRPASSKYTQDEYDAILRSNLCFGGRWAWNKLVPDADGPCVAVEWR